MPLIVGGCFIYGVDGLALLLTRADGMSGEREREKESTRAGGRFPYLATQKATTKLVHFLINNIGLKKSFENLENLKL